MLIACIFFILFFYYENIACIFFLQLWELSVMPKMDSDSKTKS